VSRAAAVRAVLALIVLALSAFYVLTKPPRLGLDLRGGTQIVLETRDSPTVKAGQESTERTLEVLRRRVDALGVSEPSIARSGERRIIVELPGVQDPRRAAAVLGRTAQLAFHPVLGTSGAPSPTTEQARTGSPSSAPAAPSPQGPQSGSPGAGPSPPSAESRIDPRGTLVLADEGGQPLRLGPAGLTGEGVEGRMPRPTLRASAAGSSPSTSAAQASGPGRS
jgi:SecD/SecF fusion protein